MDGIVLELVGRVLEGKERIIYRDYIGIGMLEGSASDETADTTESVDSERNWHGDGVCV